jgi:hypothetical protein
VIALFHATNTKEPSWLGSSACTVQRLGGYFSVESDLKASSAYTTIKFNACTLGSMRMRRKDPLSVDYTSKQKKDLGGRSGGYGIGPMLILSKVGDDVPLIIIHDALVGVVEPEYLVHCGYSRGKRGEKRK